MILRWIYNIEECRTIHTLLLVPSTMQASKVTLLSRALISTKANPHTSLLITTVPFITTLPPQQYLGLLTLETSLMKLLAKWAKRKMPQGKQSRRSAGSTNKFYMNWGVKIIMHIHLLPLLLATQIIQYSSIQRQQATATVTYCKGSFSKRGLRVLNWLCVCLMLRKKIGDWEQMEPDIVVKNNNWRSRMQNSDSSWASSDIFRTKCGLNWIILSRRIST